MQIQVLRQSKQTMKKEKGYLTVEMTLVFSVVFFSLLMLMFMGMVLYQQVNLQSLAVRDIFQGSRDIWLPHGRYGDGSEEAI